MSARTHGFKPDELLLNLAEQVKQPFVQITHAAENLEGITGLEQVESHRKSILLASRSALRLIDGYLLSVQLQNDNQLALEPVSLSSVMYDTGEMLEEFARAHGCELETRVNGRYGPVMTNRVAVQAALVSMGLGFIEAAATNDSKKRPVVRLAIGKKVHGISAGVFSSSEGLSGKLLEQARRLQGRVHQPLAGFDSGNGAGIMIADSLFSCLNAPIKVSRSQGLQGLAATLLQSKQLSLV